MTTNILKGTLLACTIALLFSFDMPTGWVKGGSEPAKFEMGIDKGAGQGGKNAATIKATDKTVKGFGSLLQNCLPEKYIGKRIRLSGMMKSKDVTGWAGFMVRVGQKTTTLPAAFDNMYRRPVKGTTDWKKYEVVLDVPATATIISYGALLHGTGQIWFSNLNFEIVPNTVPVTDKVAPKPVEKPAPTKATGSLKEPTNLDFNH